MIRTSTLLGLLLLQAACNRSAQSTAPQPEPAVKVATIKVAERPMQHYLTLTGSLQGNTSADVAANTSGVVQKTLIERGSLVASGQELLHIDPRSAGFSSEEAEAQLQGARTQLEQAQADCARFDKLYAAGATSRAEYERQRATCTSAQWTARAAEARLHNARKLFGETSVRAPFAGMIAERYISTGEYVRPETKVARLVAIDPLRLELTVPEADVALVREQQPVDFHVAAFARETFGGSIRYIGPAVRSSSRDLIVEAVVPNPERRLRPGMFATARVSLGTRPVPVLPLQAVRRDGTLNRIFAVVSGHLEERLAQLGTEQDGLAEVIQGARAGEVVVSPVTEAAQDGARVAE